MCFPASSAACGCHCGKLLRPHKGSIDLLQRAGAAGSSKGKVGGSAGMGAFIKPPITEPPIVLDPPGVSDDTEMGGAGRQVAAFCILAVQLDGQPQVIDRIGVAQRIFV